MNHQPDQSHRIAPLLPAHPSIIRNRRASDTTLAIVFEEGEGDSGATGNSGWCQANFSIKYSAFFLRKDIFCTVHIN